LPLRSDQPFGPRAAHYRNTVLATLAGALSLGLLGGGLLNPTGFVARLRELTGGASQDWMSYARTPKGVLTNIIDIGLGQETYYWPWLVVALCWVGVGIVIVNRGGDGVRSRTFRLLPLCAGMSSVVFFTLVVGRCEHRFVLPFGFWLAYYGGVASAALLSRFASTGGRALRIAQGVLATLVVWAAGHSFEVQLTQHGDARNEVRAYLDGLDEGTVVETYGWLVHLPHFDVSSDSPYRLQRVSRRPIPERNPLVGSEEIDAPYGDVRVRKPDVLVVPESTAQEFIPRRLGEGMAESAVGERAQADMDAQAFFRSVLNDSLEGYRVALITEPKLPAWAKALGADSVQVHSSVGNRQWVLVRSDR